jgi:menaquinone-dependent protoporphyrinogen oxidase
VHVLVGYASRHGSTREVAERIAARLRTSGHDVDVAELRGTEPADPYDAVVVGSAVYAGKWLGGASTYLRFNAAVLAQRPVWTFTVGSLAGQGGMLRRVTWPDAQDLEAVQRGVQLQEHRFFAGVMDRSALPHLQRWAFRAVGGRFGDFRPWAEIDAWADAIGAALTR